MGSLLPLSNSNIGLRLCFRFILCERKILKTEAESVEDIVAASNSAVVRDIVSAELKLLPTQKINNPVNKVVRTTPSVESIIPWAIIGLISLYLVSIPPEKRINRQPE